jgi:hypothetical protein
VSLMVKRFIDYLERLEMKNPPSSAVGNLYMGLFKLIASNSAAQHQEDMDRMNLEQIKRAQMMEMMKTLVGAASRDSVKRLLEQVVSQSSGEGASEING